MLICVAWVTVQRRVADCPRSMVEGSAEKLIEGRSGGGAGTGAAGAGGGGGGGTFFLQAPANIRTNSPSTRMLAWRHLIALCSSVQNAHTRNLLGPGNPKKQPHQRTN